MKKIGILFVALTLIMTLCGCGIIKDVIPTDLLDKLPVDLGNFGNEIAVEEFTETYVCETTEEYTEVVETTYVEETYVVETEATEVAVDANDGEISILMRKLGTEGSLGENSGWYVSWYSLYLSDDDAKEYPALAYALEKINAENFYENDMEAAGFADFTPDFDVYLYAESKYNVLRADDSIVSIRSNFDCYYGGAHGGHYFTGYNIDTETGAQINITDMVVSLDMLYVILADYLNANYADELYSEVSANSLYNMYEDDPAWMVDNEKLIVCFNEYEIAPYSAGVFEVEIPFGEYSYLFAEKYVK